MLRAAEAMSALAPLFAAALLYGIVYRRLPSRRAVLLITLAELAVAVALIWQGTSEGLRPHQLYVPAQVHDGTVVEGHGG